MVHIRVIYVIQPFKNLSEKAAQCFKIFKIATSTLAASLTIAFARTKWHAKRNDLDNWMSLILFWKQIIQLLLRIHRRVTCQNILKSLEIFPFQRKFQSEEGHLKFLKLTRWQHRLWCRKNKTVTCRVHVIHSLI